VDAKSPLKGFNPREGGGDKEAAIEGEAGAVLKL